MFFSLDMKDLLTLFDTHSVAFVLVGGYAVNYYGYGRFTQDIDLLVYPSKENAKKVMAALRDFGFGQAGIPENHFEKSGSVLHLGVEPNRIDLLTGLKGLENDKVFDNSQQIELAGHSIRVIDFEDLVRAKKLSDRPRDQLDAAELLKIKNGGL